GESPVLVFGLDGGIDRCAERLAGQGVEIVVPVSEAPDGGLTLDFLDPDGTVPSLYQPPGAPRRRRAPADVRVATGGCGRIAASIPSNPRMPAQPEAWPSQQQRFPEGNPAPARSAARG